MADKKEPKAGNPLEAAGFRIVGLDPAATRVYIPITGREYVLADLHPEQAEQLLKLGWPHIERIPLDQRVPVA